ncbi:FHA domain-containing protein [Candidatus Poseidoniales archaeon]|nr:FHA domain-containing protein [Candidatus Poseidoniales archaeon]
MTNKTVVVVDGSNVIHANIGTKKCFKVQRIKNVIEKLKKLGYTYKVGMKKGTYHFIMNKATEEQISEADKTELATLIDSLEVSLLNSSKDDRWIHLAAIEFDGYILSHDQFRDEIAKWEEEGRGDIAKQVAERRIDLEFFDDSPIFNLPDISDKSILLDIDGKVVFIDKKESVDSHDEKETDEIEGIEVENGDDQYAHAKIDSEIPYLQSLIRIGNEEANWEEFKLPLDEVIGRTFFAELLGVDDSTTDVLKKISRDHLEVALPGTTGGEPQVTRLHIQDKNSTNGTLVDGARLGKIGHVADMSFDESAMGHPPWPSIHLGSRLIEIRMGALLADSSHPCFSSCRCDLITG